MRCPHCGDDTFTIAGWAEHDHCATCGRPLGGHVIEISAALKAKRRFTRTPEVAAQPTRRHRART